LEGDSGKPDGGAKAVPYINVTPLIDVLLVVLITAPGTARV
jgi:biopolymer transport protein ExbD